MDVYEAIASRQTIRDFSTQAIPQEVIERLLSAGLQAPSNDHLRRWEFILVQDAQQREKLVSKIHPPQSARGMDTLVRRMQLSDDSQREMYRQAIPKQVSMLLNAPLLIIPCFYASGDLLHPETLSSLNSFASMWCCIENILIAAAAEGIFGVNRIPFEPERGHLRRVLHIPPEYEVPCYLALGYPAEGAQRARQNPVAIQDKLHHDLW
ncbi:MAG: 5,6-dimethylbenzimidazole synthase [Chloroflexota bacterium]|nr:5,6-dimethylbenzimidazole synthase [Chloroflexota bacterium]